MGAIWKQHEGQRVDEGVVLGDYLGGGDHSGVFRAQPPARGVVKLIRGEARDAAAQLATWERAAKLSHPNLARLERWGRCEVGGQSMLYVITEYADEVLGDVLRERALSIEETRQMLGPVVGVLEYLHANGFVHGRIQPSNIFAVNEQLKVSSDGITEPAAVLRDRSPAADALLLGRTIVAALTVPDASAAPELPEPLRRIVDRCLRADPAERWTMAQIRDCLRGGAAARPGAARRYGLLPAAVAAALVLATVWLWPGIGPSRAPEPSPGASGTPAGPVAAPPDERPSPMPASRQPEPGGVSAGSPQPPAPPASTAAGLPSEVLSPVLPEVPEKALRTVSGRFSVRVRVQVDTNGEVTSAQLDSPGPSRYFANLALDAARLWKFAAGGSDRRRLIEFEFSPAGAQVIAVR